MTTGRINQVAFLMDAGVARARPAPGGADGPEASATVVRKEHSSGQIGGNEDPMPTASTESESPNCRPRTTPPHDEARATGDATAASGSPRAPSARGERQLIARGNAGALGMQHRKPTPGKPKQRLPRD